MTYMSRAVSEGELTESRHGERTGKNSRLQNSLTKNNNGPNLKTDQT